MTDATVHPIRTPDAERTADAFTVSVIVATYNRAASLARLLGLLADQTLSADQFEVVVVDDGSTLPVRDALAALLALGALPYAVRLVAQPNAGPGAARHHAITLARGALLVIVDDDMRVGRDFLAEHVAAHPHGSRRVVLGRLRPEPGTRLPLFERFQLAKIERLAADVARGTRRAGGGDMYTGNVSLPRADYDAVGGFDPALRLSEDAELGMRLEQAGLDFVLSDAAEAWHASDHTSVAKWMRRAQAYGASDARIAAKHGGRPDTSPWRFLFMVSALSRPFMLLAVLAPALARVIAWAAVVAASALGALGMERLALAGATFAYGLQYFAGVRAAADTRRVALGDLRRHLNAVREDTLPPIGRVLKCAADVCADHDAIRRADAKYKAAPPPARFLPDLVQKVGFQMMAAYRVMRLLRALHLTLFAKIASRLIRHLYAAELHWDAELAPGVVLVHGTGLVVGHGARVGPGCILFQHATLGESMHPDGHAIGTPTLEADVHVGPGAALLGPITVGHGTKVTANALVMRSVPPMSLVETAPVTVRSRQSGARR
ncbi:MAG TPA: glycosyltransferase, partial [Gemmatirosa sp.]